MGQLQLDQNYQTCPKLAQLCAKLGQRILQNGTARQLHWTHWTQPTDLSSLSLACFAKMFSILLTG